MELNASTGMEGRAFCEGGLAGTGIDRHEAKNDLREQGVPFEY